MGCAMHWLRGDYCYSFAPSLALDDGGAAVFCATSDGRGHHVLQSLHDHSTVLGGGAV